MAESSLARDLLLALDPVELSLASSLTPDPWQAKFLRSNAPRILLNCTRQAGKSTMAATLAVHTALFDPGALVLLLSPSLRQSGEIFKKALACLRATDTPTETAAESALRLELENGSRIVSLPGTESTVRGYSGVKLLIVDEASRVPDDLYFAIRPMLAVSSGRLVGLSTPYGTRGWYYEAWRSTDAWERYEVPAEQCPRISREFLEEEKRSLGAWWFSQEYGCQFCDSENQPFTAEDIDRAFAEDVETWDL